jgi:hypothetical protein
MNGILCYYSSYFYTFVLNELFIMIEYTYINNQYHDLQNVFTISFFIVSLLIVFNMYASRAKYILNITRPNIFVFEYERQSKSIFSSYQILNLIIRVIGYTLFFTSLMFYIAKSSGRYLHIDNFAILFFLSLFFVLFKPVIIGLYLILIKKSADLYLIRHIRVAFEVFFNFYLVILSFLIFFIPYHKMLIFILIMILLAVFYVYYLLNYFNSLTKHIKFKTYQLILYLCISEILPIMLVIYWLSFHII